MEESNTANNNSKNFFEKIGIFVPGYIGYAVREGRRETDKLLRDNFARILYEKKRILDEVMLAMTNAHKLGVLNDLDRIKKKLEKVIDRIKYASHGASGVFDVVQIKEKELEVLYKYDLSLAESINQFSSRIEIIKDILQKDEKEIKSFANELTDILNQFDKNLDSRNRCIQDVK